MTLVDSFLEGAGVSIEATEKLLRDWLGSHADGGASVVELCHYVTDTDPDWPVETKIGDRVSAGVYTPLQLLGLATGGIVEKRSDLEYPFCFSHVALVVQMLIDEIRRGDEDHPLQAWPPPADYYNDVRNLLQAIFQRREVREEGVAPSLEVYVPVEDAGTELVSANKIGQVFGRGVATVQGEGLQERPASNGHVVGVFGSHHGAPSSQLYGLKDPLEHVPPDRISIALRRDGHITVATKRNSLFEFYNGGWHVVDLRHARLALSEIFQSRFGHAEPEGFVQQVLNLAYHMATHWLSGIIAIVPEFAAESSGADGIFENVSEESLQVTAAVQESLSRLGAVEDIRLGRLCEEGYGRVLLTTAIQDGALVLTPGGKFHSGGRMVREIQKASEGGAGARAAKTIGTRGIAIKISEDGSIKVFSSKDGIGYTPSSGLRLH